MVNDGANAQTTDDTDSETRFDLVLYGNKPERQKESAQAKRLRVVFLVWAFVGFVATVAGLLLLGRFVPTPIVIGLAALWIVSVWAAQGQGSALVRQNKIKDDHYWQDRIDDIWLKFKENIFDPLANFKQEQKERSAELDQIKKLSGGVDQIMAAAREAQEQERLTAGRRGRGKDTGRPETTREEWVQRGRKIIEVEECHNRQQISYEQACARAGVVYSTFRDWRRKIPKDYLDEARTHMTRN
jgi:hypothetical protein